jgi:site-specific DNA recombinase
VEIARWHTDEDESGGTHERPGLEAATGRALAGESGGIVAMNISRFSRFTEGGLRDLRRLEEAGARLAFTDQEIDTSTPGGRMVYTILLAVHEAALEQIKAGWRVAKQRAISGGRQIGPTPLGYRRTRIKNGRPQGSLVPDPATAPAVREAFRLAGTKGLQAAADHLATAVPEKTFTARKRTVAERYGVAVGDRVTVKATWNTTTVRRLVTSPVYRGEAYYRYADGTEHFNPTAHEALVDERTFALAQVAADDTRVVRARQTFPLSGIATCAGCGNPLVGSRSGAGEARRRVYKCSSVSRKREQCDARAIILAEPLEQYVAVKLAKRLAERAESGEQGPDLAELERRVERSQAELNEWAAMSRVDREDLKDAYNAGLATRRQERNDAARALQEAQAHGSPDPEGVWLDVMYRAGSELGVDLTGLRDVFKPAIRSLMVANGRGSSLKRLNERVTLELR